MAWPERCGRCAERYCKTGGWSSGDFRDVRRARRARCARQARRPGWWNRHVGAEVPKVHFAGVSGQKVVEALIVGLGHAEQGEQCAVIAFGFPQPATDQLANIVPCEIAFEEQRMDVIPERV